MLSVQPKTGREGATSIIGINRSLELYRGLCSISSTGLHRRASFCRTSPDAIHRFCFLQEDLQVHLQCTDNEGQLESLVDAWMDDAQLTDNVL